MRRILFHFAIATVSFIAGSIAQRAFHPPPRENLAATTRSVQRYAEPAAPSPPSSKPEAPPRPPPCETCPVVRRIEKLPCARTASPIRSVDFANFSFPSCCDLFPYHNNFTLRQGFLPPRLDEEGAIEGAGADLVSVKYGDLTGDKGEEAIVVVSPTGGGIAEPHLVYVYTLKNKHPSLLWFFQTGDRAYGGLRDAYAERGELVVELYGYDSLPGRREDVKVCGVACCPCAFTRSRYRWRDGEFKPKGKPQAISL